MVNLLMNKKSDSKKIPFRRSLVVSVVGFFIILLASATTVIPYLTNASNSKEIQRLESEINEKRSALEELDKEIARQKAALQNASGRANNLQDKIYQLESSRRKILDDISYTETQIQKAELTLQKLDYEISDKELLINKNSSALAESIRKLSNLKSLSLIEKLLGYPTLSDFWNDFEQTERIQKQLGSEVDELRDLYNDLTKKEIEKIKEKEELSQYHVALASEREAVEYTKQEQAALLDKTRSEEAAYQALLQEKLAQKAAFEEELLEIESMLHVLIDPDSYPDARNGILAWPLDTIRVTQEFGGTAFAKTNPGVYGRPYHPGTDFGVPIGTKVKSVAEGTVIGTGNTDAYPGCYAWGKWILVEHGNGLSSLYAHLSSISVSSGQRVSRGQVIGLSGNTGISTGPHLHLSIYASQGVSVGRYNQYKSGTGCAATDATGPFADLDAYLDPMEYLPSL